MKATSFPVLPPTLPSVLRIPLPALLNAGPALVVTLDRPSLALLLNSAALSVALPAVSFAASVALAVFELNLMEFLACLAVRRKTREGML